jgi:predicted secreted Zn-dependent protease
MRSLVASLAGLAAVLAISGPVDARPHQTTTYAYYTVSGRSAAEIYRAMLLRGPHVDGQKAYAATSARHKLGGRFIQGASCNLSNISLSFDFKIQLPKLQSDIALTGRTRSNWIAFAAFVRKHEETHRAIWLGCARELEQRLQSLKAKDCTTAEQQVEKLDTDIWNLCNAKHNAFDAAEQLRLAKHPFVKLVMSRAGAQTAAFSSKLPRKNIGSAF